MTAPVDDRVTSGAASQRQGLLRLQLRRDGDGRHRWYLFNAYGTMVGRHEEGFPTELEARRDAEQFQQEIARTKITGEVYEAARGGA